MKPLETGRLLIGPLSFDDCAFIVELLNEPSFKRFIGDKEVRTPGDARNYLAEGPLASYASAGFGMYRVALGDNDTPLGMCGLMDRPQFDDPDLGFAFLKRHRGQGYALEAARAVLAHGFGALGLGRILAMADADNLRSIRLLEKLGFESVGMVRMEDDEHDVRQFAIDA